MGGKRGAPTPHGGLQECGLLRNARGTKRLGYETSGSHTREPYRRVGTALQKTSLLGKVAIFFERLGSPALDDS